MAYENTAGLGVTNQYGPRQTGGAIGVETTDNTTSILRVDLTGEMLNSAYVAPIVMPKGALVRKVYLRVDEAFALSAGTVSIGGAAPATDGVALTKAKLEAVGTSDVSTLAVGTWATASATGPLTAQKIAKVITGGTLTATQGKGTLIVEYAYVTKV